MTVYTLEEQKVNRKAWVAALRSGDYEQCTSTLANGKGGFCCLGVAADLAQKAGVNFKHAIWREATLGYTFAEAQHRLGLTTPQGVFEDGMGMERSLSGLNDSGSTFTEIADIIESEPIGLFLFRETVYTQ